MDLNRVVGECSSNDRSAVSKSSNAFVRYSPQHSPGNQKYTFSGNSGSNSGEMNKVDWSEGSSSYDKIKLGDINLYEIAKQIKKESRNSHGSLLNSENGGMSNSIDLSNSNSERNR